MSHNHSDGHNHSHPDLKGRKLLFSIFLNVLITIAQVVGGIISGSLSLLSDALHNFSDEFPEIKNVHYMHIWQLNEKETPMEAHLDFTRTLRFQNLMMFLQGLKTCFITGLELITLPSSPNTERMIPKI